MPTWHWHTDKILSTIILFHALVRRGVGQFLIVIHKLIYNWVFINMNAKMFVMSGKDPRLFWLSHVATDAKFFLTFEAYEKMGHAFGKKRK